MISPTGSHGSVVNDKQAVYEGHCDVLIVYFAEIPSYLHDSAFYKSLGADEENVDDASISVPRQCFKQDDTISSLEELTNMFHAMMFWGIDEIPFSVLDFCHGKHIGEWHHIATDVLDAGTCNALFAYFANNCSIDGVIQSNRWQMLRHWMQLHPPEDQTSFLAIFGIVKYGSLDLIKKLHEHGYPLDPAVCVVAAEHGHVDCLQYFHENSCVLTAEAATAAAKFGQVKSLQYLLNHKCPLDVSACTAAAERGSVECLQLLHENDCKWEDAITAEAARHNHLECLQYALFNGCPVHKDACFYAAAHSVECLRMLYDHNPDLKWTSRIANNAARNGQLNTLQYAIEHGCLIDDETISAAIEYTAASCLPCVQYLVEVEQMYMDERGFPFSEALMRANVECVRYLVDIGCPCVIRRMRYIKLDNSKDKQLAECIEYMMEHGWACGEYFIQLVFASYLPQCQEYLLKEGYGSSNSRILGIQDNVENEDDGSDSCSSSGRFTGLFDSSSCSSDSDAD